MNSLDDVFTYDNTDDGLGWWTRFTHHIPTGYYGYPYDYHPHRDRHLPRISESRRRLARRRRLLSRSRPAGEVSRRRVHVRLGQARCRSSSRRSRGATYHRRDGRLLRRRGKRGLQPAGRLLQPRRQIHVRRRLELRRLGQPAARWPTLSRQLRRRQKDSNRSPPSPRDTPTARVSTRRSPSLAPQRTASGCARQEQLIKRGQGALAPLTRVIVDKNAAAAGLDSCDLGAGTGWWMW